jgi:hypothetical protein
MQKTATRWLLFCACLGFGAGVLAGCASGPSDGGGDDDDDGGGNREGVACGYYLERGTYSTVNLQVLDVNDEATWTAGLPLSRRARNPAGAFAWIPLSQPTLLARGAESAGGLGKVANDARCGEALDLFSRIDALNGDPDGFTYVEQQAELSVQAVDFAFPGTLADAEAVPDSQDVAVRIVADFTRDKTRAVGNGEVRQQIARQTVTLTATCTPASRVTRSWAAKADRDDPAFCRPAGTATECVQFNLLFAPERCTLATDRVTLQLPSGRSEVSLGGTLTRESTNAYAIRIDDVRLFGDAR